MSRGSPKLFARTATEHRMIGTLIQEPDCSIVANTDGALTVRAFCERYSIGRTAVYEEINAGRLIAKKRGARVLIERAEARRWFSTLPTFVKAAETAA